MAAKKKPGASTVVPPDVMSIPPAEAFERVSAELQAMRVEHFVKTRVDFAAVASLVLTKVRSAVTPALRARLAALPAEEFDVSQVDRSQLYARALLHLAARRDAAVAIETSALVPADVFAAGTTLKREMVRVLDYHLEEDDARRDLADIISGQGYVDLAQDLRRLADLYRRFSSQLQADKRRYRAADAERASTLADRIAPQKGGGEAANWLRLCQAAWTQVDAAYRDLRATVMWLHRNDGALPDLPVLLSALASGGKPDPAEKSDPPAPAPEPT
jgi:hypothetical protein